jgi:hypothetical protein
MGEIDAAHRIKEKGGKGNEIRGNGSDFSNGFYIQLRF